MLSASFNLNKIGSHDKIGQNNDPEGSGRKTFITETQNN
jgi:hypothetical protein